MTVTQPPSIQVVSIICCAVLGSTLLAIFCYCAWKLHRNRQFGGQTYSHGHSCRNGVNNGSHVAANRSIISNGMRNGATENLIRSVNLFIALDAKLASTMSNSLFVQRHQIEISREMIFCGCGFIGKFYLQGPPDGR